MMKKINSKDIPVICRRKQKIMVPVRVTQIESSTDGKTNVDDPAAGYEFSCLEIDDRGQDLDNPKVVAALQKEALDAAAKLTYEEAIAKGCLTSSGIVMDCTPEACAALTHTVCAYQMTALDDQKTMIWIRDFHNNNHKISWADFKKMYQDIHAYVQDLRHEKWGIK
jgi:hypothetical protein